MKLRPAQAECRRCEQLFAYFRCHRSRPRVYCSPCIDLERQDANLFFNAWTKRRRREAASA